MIKRVIGFTTLADAALALIGVYYKDFLILGIAALLGIAVSVLALMTYEER